MQVVGETTLILNNKCLLKLKDYFYVLECKKNLILVFSLCKLNYLVYFNKSIIIKRNDSFISLGSLIDNFYNVTSLKISPSNENNHILLA